MYKVYADIRESSSCRGRQTTVGLSTTTIIFGYFGGFSLETIEIRPTLLYGNKQSPSVVGVERSQRSLMKTVRQWCLHFLSRRH